MNKKIIMMIGGDVKVENRNRIKIYPYKLYENGRTTSTRFSVISKNWNFKQISHGIWEFNKYA